jgi:hypothetical protein
MTSSLNRTVRFGVDSLRGAVVILDRGLRLQDVAVRNAARAVAAERVAARLRAEAAAALPATLPATAERPELSLVGA